MSDSSLPKQIGPYRIEGELGRGAMGIVYYGRDPQSGSRVAIKTARRELIAGPAASPDALKRFFREARVAGMLKHPNIITVYESGEQDDTAFIVMEYIDGHDLGARIAKGPRFTVEEAVELAAALSEALAFAHKRGVVHRDVKPANIMLSNGGPPKLADFGIAHVIDSTLTQEGALIGSPTYMSPEQFMGQRVDGRSDQFSLGVVLYELLTGERPFAGAAFSTVMHHVLKTEPAQPCELNFAVGQALSRVVMKALAKAPQDRYPDGRAFAMALRNAVQAPSPATPRPPSQNATVRMNAEEFFAQLPAQPPQPAGQAAMPFEQLPPNTLPRSSAASYNGADPDESYADTTARTAKDMQRSALSVRTAIAVLLLLGGIAVLLYAQRTPKIVDLSAAQPPAAQQPPAAVMLDTPNDPPEAVKVVGTVKVAVFATDNEEEFARYERVYKGGGSMEAYRLEAEASGRIQRLRGTDYSIAVFNSDTASQPAFTETLTENGEAELSLPEDAPRVTFKIYRSGTILLTVELDAFACQTPQTFLVPPTKHAAPAGQ